MQEFNIANDEPRPDELNELEPMILGDVKEITGSGEGSDLDENIVWGEGPPA